MTEKKAASAIKIKKSDKSMDELLKAQKDRGSFDAALGEIVDGVITAITKSAIIVDLADGMVTGIIPSRESKDSLGTAQNIQVGDQIQAVLVEPENEDGNFILSLRKASQLSAWDRFEASVEDNGTFRVQPVMANRGGLICDIDGIRGFIPVSQLMPQHYPRVENSSSEMILEKLKKLLGKDLKVCVMVVDQGQDKLIFSERKAYEAERSQILEKLSPGQVIKGRVSGFSHFGIFLTIPGGIEGLVHISEIAWERVQNPRDYAREGEDIEVIVLSADLNRVAFSMKRLIEDPWVAAAGKFKEGEMVEGPVTQIVDYGAFVRLNDEVNGLIHKTQLADEEPENITDVINVGDIVKAKIINVELNEHRVGLSLRDLDSKPKKKVEEPVTESEKKTKKETKEDKEEKPKKKVTKTDEKKEKKPAKKTPVKKVATKAKDFKAKK